VQQARGGDTATLYLSAGNVAELPNIEKDPREKALIALPTS
jgi:hypothetical protein